MRLSETLTISRRHKNMSLLSSVTEPVIWLARTFLLIGEIDSLRSILCAGSMLCSLIVVRATWEKFCRGFSPVSLEEGCEEPSGGLTQWPLNTRDLFG